MIKVIWHVRGRRKSDFAVVDVEHQDEAMAQKEARHLHANGFDVTVHLMMRELIAEWTHDA